jgi:glycerophosphoryl diester phosphodiesterase
MLWQKGSSDPSRVVPIDQSGLVRSAVYARSVPLPPREGPPIAFGHRGARAHAPDNTIESFTLARRLGATGLESDVWRTADGEAVLDHDGVVRAGVRRRSVRDVARRDLPGHVPTLAELYDACGTDFDLSLDVKDPAAIDAVLAAARAAGGDAEQRLWLCHHDWNVVATWRPLTTEARLVDSTRLRAMRQGPERRAAQLADAGIDGVNMHHTDWTAGLVALFHRFDVRAFAWDAQFERIITALVAMDIDGIYSDHVDRLINALG